TVGIATGKAPGMATRDVEGWIVTPSTTAKWSASGGPPLSGGYYVAVFRAMSTGTALASGVAMTRSGGMIPDQDQYFVATETTRETVDPAATVTGVNGTALITGASVAQNVVYSGTGALP